MLCRHVIVQLLIFFAVSKPCKCFWEGHFLVARSVTSLFSLAAQNPAWSACCLWWQSWFRSSYLPHLRLLIPATEQQVTAPQQRWSNSYITEITQGFYLNHLAKCFGGFFVRLLFGGLLNPVWWLAQLHRIKPAQLRTWSVIAVGQE